MSNLEVPIKYKLTNTKIYFNFTNLYYLKLKIVKKYINIKKIYYFWQIFLN